MPSLPRLLRRPRTDLRHPAKASLLLRDKRSVVAVEMSLIGLAFFFFAFGIFTISIVQYWTMVLDDAVRNAARQTQIGNILTNTDFLNSVCNEFGVTAVGCTSSLQFDVQANTYFTNTNTSASIIPASFNGNLSVNLANNAVNTPLSLSTTVLAAAGQSGGASGTPGIVKVLLVQVVYPLPFNFPWLGGAMTENGTSSLYSVVTTIME